MSVSIEKYSYIQHDRIIYPNIQEIKRTIEADENILQLNIMDAFHFERMFVQIIAEIAEKRGIPDARLAREAWPHQKAAATAWRRMRNNDENPKRLNLEEAFLLTQYLGLSISDICGMVQGRLMDMPEDSKKNSSSDKNPVKRPMEAALFEPVEEL